MANSSSSPSVLTASSSIIMQIGHAAAKMFAPVLRASLTLILLGLSLPLLIEVHTILDWPNRG